MVDASQPNDRLSVASECCYILLSSFGFSQGKFKIWSGKSQGISDSKIRTNPDIHGFGCLISTLFWQKVYRAETHFSLVCISGYVETCKHIPSGYMRNLHCFA